MYPKESQNRPNWLHQVRNGFQCILCDQSCGLDRDLEAHIGQDHPIEPIIDLDEPTSLPSAQVSTEGSTLSSSSSPGRSPIPTLSVSPSTTHHPEAEEERPAPCYSGAEGTSKNNPVNKNNERVHGPKTQNHTNEAQHPERNAQYEPVPSYMSPARPLREDETGPQDQAQTPSVCHNHKSTFKPKLTRFSGDSLPHFFEWRKESVMKMQRLNVPYHLKGKMHQRVPSGTSYEHG
jgi:hypothetical protein